MDMKVHQFTFVVSLVVIPMCKTVPQGEIKLTSNSHKCMGTNSCIPHIVYFLLRVT